MTDLPTVLRWLTAGESHGPALVAILEGLPAHVRVTTADLAEALARRRLGFGRGARMKFEADAVTILGGVRHGETQGGPVADPDRQHRVAEVGDGDGGRPGAGGGAGRAGAERAADPAAAGARRPGRDAEVRLRRGAAGAGAGQRPGDRRPGGARPGRRPTSWTRPSASRLLSHVVELGTVAAPAGRAAAARRPGRGRRRPGALLRPGDERGHGRGGASRPRRTATPSAGWSRWWPGDCRPGSARTCTGTGGWTPGWPEP